jgi:hypothetical protein
VPKFLLNLIVEILKVLPNSEIYLNSKIKNLFIFHPFISPAGPFWPFGPPSPTGLPLPSSLRRPNPSWAATSLHRLAWPACSLGVFLGICFLIVKAPATEPTDLLLPPPTPNQSMPAAIGSRPQAAPMAAPMSHTVFKAKTRCSSFVCPGSSCHTYGQNVSTENQCLYYIVSYYKNLLQVHKGLNSGMNTILPQADDWGFHTPRRSLRQSTSHLLSSRA